MNETELMKISQCNICTLSSHMKHCQECNFKMGLDYWTCRCANDSIRHKSELFCIRCDTDRPPKFKAFPVSKEMLKTELWLNTLYD